jgi:hypothetical protein
MQGVYAAIEPSSVQLVIVVPGKLQLLLSVLNDAVRI